MITDIEQVQLAAVRSWLDTTEVLLVADRRAEASWKIRHLMRDLLTLADAVKFLELPRELGAHPKTGEPIIANTGQYGPYLAHAGDFRSLKAPDDPYTITYKCALEIYAQPKTARKGEKLLLELGINPVTRKMVNVFESKSGRYMRKGFKRISIPEDMSTSDITLEFAIALLKS